jgi:RNA polymerase sigma-70 factor (ECF subfamily)
LPAIHPQNETLLILNAKNGDRNAFGELVCLYANKLIQIIYRMYGNQQLAEDAVQKAFIQSWLQLSAYQPKASFQSWLVRIAINTAIDMLRKEKQLLPNNAEILDVADSSPGPESMMIKKENAILVRQAVLSLPDASRVVLILREYEALSYQEISEILDIPIGTVMSRLNYARKILKEKLKNHILSPKEAVNVYAYD